MSKDPTAESPGIDKEMDSAAERMRQQNRIAKIVAQDMENVGNIYNRDFHRDEEMVQRLAQKIACRVLDDDFETI